MISKLNSGVIEVFLSWPVESMLNVTTLNSDIFLPIIVRMTQILRHMLLFTTKTFMYFYISIMSVEDIKVLYIIGWEKLLKFLVFWQISVMDGLPPGCVKAFVQRDYSDGMTVKFEKNLPRELEGRVSVNILNLINRNLYKWHILPTCWFVIMHFKSFPTYVLLDPTGAVWRDHWSFEQYICWSRTADMWDFLWRLLCMSHLLSLSMLHENTLWEG